MHCESGVHLLDHTNRYNIVFAVDCGELGAHTENCAVSAGNGCFVQAGERADQLVARINRALDLQRMQHAVALNDHVDFIAIAIAVVPQQALPGIVVVGL